jgi:hypothetical protein
VRHDLRPKLFKAISIALISAGITPAVNAEVNDLDVNNPNGTTITNSSTGNAVDLDNGGSFTVINNGTISSSATNNAYGVIADSSTTITTLSNTKTITGTASNSNGYGIGIGAATLNNLTNTGTISGTAANDIGRGIILMNTSTATNLTNSGTISGTAGDDLGYGVVVSTSTLTNLTNSGTISGTSVDDSGYGVFVSTSTLTNLTNTGIISGTAGDDTGFGVNVQVASTLTNLTNSGTISGTADLAGIGVVVDASTLTNLTNSGTISGTATNQGLGMYVNSSTLTNLTNSGTISGTVTTQYGFGVVVSTSTLTNLTNSGTISGTAGDDSGIGVFLTSSSTLTNLTNSGTISGTAGDDLGYGVNVSSSSTLTNLVNTGTISGTAGDIVGYGVNVSSSSTLTNLTNTGTITGTATTSAFDIKVGSASNLVNLNNLQSDLSYNGRLPRNYKTIIQGSNYGSLAISGTPTESSTGDTVYTPFAGSSNIGVYIPSGSYTNVMTGMPDANLHSTVSGTLTGDGTDSVGTVNWALTETSSGSNNWNLTTSGGSYTYIGKDNTQSAINQTTKNVGGVFQNVSAGGNFANMTTYDCDLFNGRENCISVGGRVTESSGKDTSIVLVAGQKINENLRIGGYIDQTINHDNYNDINIDVNVPLIGAMAVWNESADQQGLQLKFSNSYQSNDAEITRAVVGTSELAKGDTTIETQSYIAEASYRIENAVSDITLKPFGAVRYMKTELDSYTEKNIGAPVTYSEMDEENVAAIVGIKAYYDLSSKVKLNASLGLEHDLNNNDAELKGTISGISAFNSSSIGNDKNDTRALASLGAHLYLDHGDRVEVKGMYQELRYKKDDATTVYITYTLPF